MKVRRKGDRYRPVVTILKTTTTKAGKTYPTVIRVSGREYQLRLAGHTKNRRARNNDNDELAWEYAKVKAETGVWK